MEEPATEVIEKTGFAVANSRLRNTQCHISTIDALTDLCNRCYVEAALRRDKAR